MALKSLTLLETANDRRLSPLKTGSLRSQVVQAVRNAIFSGKLEAGEVLRETHLARELQVSQATVREALLELEHAGLIVRPANTSATVTKLTKQEVRERLAMRVLLEGLAATQAAPALTNQDFAELDRLVAAVAQAIDRNAYFESAEADLQFHRYIWERSGSPTLYRILDQLTAPLFAFVSVLRSGSHEKLKDTIRSHEPIVASLRGGNRDEIRQAMRLHIESSYTLFPDTEDADAQALAESLR
jgi:DNA-binding GntR family transcriptional regulator